MNDVQDEAVKQEPTILDLIREKYAQETRHPRSDVLTDDDLKDLPARDRDAILAARSRRAWQRERRRKR